MYIHSKNSILQFYYKSHRRPSFLSHIMHGVSKNSILQFYLKSEIPPNKLRPARNETTILKSQRIEQFFFSITTFYTLQADLSTIGTLHMQVVENIGAHRSS
jgi:hypothetical protein